MTAVGGCTHTESMPTGPWPAAVGPLEPGGLRMTYNAGDDYAPAWSADGKALLYAFSLPAVTTLPTPPRHGSRCFAILPAGGGTRLLTYCDERSSHTDSVEMFGGLGLGPRGQLIFVQASSLARQLAPQTPALWITDTIAPEGHRRLVHKMPIAIGTLAVNWISGIEWTGDDAFIGVGSNIRISAGRRIDTLFLPRGLVRGSSVAGSERVDAIAGGEQGAFASPDGDGGILFARAAVLEPDENNPELRIVHEPVLRRVPLGGGTATVVATMPDGRPIQGISCQSRRCLVLTTGSLYTFDPRTSVFTLVRARGGIADIVLAPDGRSFAYRLDGNIFREQAVFP